MDYLFIWDLIFKYIISISILLWIGEKIYEYFDENNIRSEYSINLNDWKEFSNKLDQVYSGSLAIKEGKFVDPQEVEL
tara:strand:+ start:50 stop:283 length:234 start_codon:yes stop_codon:yes gene_type:complete